MKSKVSRPQLLGEDHVEVAGIPATSLVHQIDLSDFRLQMTSRLDKHCNFFLSVNGDCVQQCRKYCDLDRDSEFHFECTMFRPSTLLVAPKCCDLASARYGILLAICYCDSSCAQVKKQGGCSSVRFRFARGTVPVVLVSIRTALGSDSSSGDRVFLSFSGV